MARAMWQVRCSRSSSRAASPGSSTTSGAISVPTSPEWLIRGSVLKPFELPFESGVADLADRERQSDPLRSAACGALGGRRAALREPDHAAVGAEVVVAQLGMAGEAQLADDGVLERPGEEVGQEVGAGLLLERGAHLVAGEDVVAVLAVEAVEAELVERAVGAAVAVREDDPV